MQEHILFVTKQFLLKRENNLNILDGDINTLIKFADQKFFLPNKNQKIGKRVQYYFNRIDFKPNAYLHTENIETILSLITANIGVGFIPESALRHLPESQLRELTFYRLGEELADWKIVSVKRKDYKLPSFTQYFLDIFKKQ